MIFYNVFELGVCRFSMGVTFCVSVCGRFWRVFVVIFGVCKYFVTLFSPVGCLN